MADKTVKVDLKRTYGKGGINYGPGKGVEVPESLARSLGLLPEQLKASAPKKKGGKKS
jgi:hypothetical protein